MQLKNIALTTSLFFLSLTTFSQGIVIEVEGSPIDISGLSHTITLTEPSSVSGNTHLVNFVIRNNTPTQQEWWITRKMIMTPPASWQDFFIWQGPGPITSVNAPNNDLISNSFETAVIPVADSAQLRTHVSSSEGGSAIYRYYISTDKVNWLDSVDLIINNVASIHSIDKDSFTVYPNPATDNITLDLEGLKIETITILNLMGKAIETIEPKSDIINVSHLTKGVYFLRIQTDKGLVSTKFIKE